MNQQQSTPSPPEPSGALSGQTVAGVELQRLIGKGGMAEVYLGRHLELDQPVAFKILLSTLRDDPNLMNLLQREAAALVSMDHPHIVNCVDCNVYHGRPYIIMDLLEGIPLADRLAYLKARGLVPALSIVDHVLQAAASALDYAHQQGIVHRDLKPANLMLVRDEQEINPTQPLTKDIQVVLTDFGVASLRDATEQQGMIVGTPDYMSPEQASGQAVDPRSDTYSLGVIVHQMLVGTVPQKRDKNLVQSLQNGPWGAAESLQANTPQRLQRVVEQALQAQPGSRFRRAGHMARAFSRALQA